MDLMMYSASFRSQFKNTEDHIVDGSFYNS